MDAKHFTISVGLAVFAAGNPFGLAAQGASSDPERAAIAAMYSSRLAAITGAGEPARAAEAYVRNITDDAVWMPPNSAPIRGKPAVLAWARAFFGQYELQVDSQAIEPVEIGGTVAIRRFTTTGRYVPRSGGAAVPFDQKYVDVLRRGPDGSWKLAAHMWSSNNSGPTIWR